MRRTLLGALLCFAGASVRAEPFEYAFEVELGPVALAQIIDYFDIDQLQSPRTEVRSEALEEAPLLEESNLDKIPVEVREKISQGLDLKKARRLEVVRNRLLVPGQEPSPEKTAPPSNVILGADGRPAREASDWPILQDRWEDYWKSLKPAQRLRLIPWSMLPKQERARLAIALVPAFKGTGNDIIPLRPDAPEKFRKLMQKLTWGRDGGTMEFQHRTFVTDPEEFLSDLEFLALLTGTRRSFEDPMNVPGHASYHLNISQGQRRLAHFGKAYNQLLLARIAAAGRAKDALQKGSVTYTSDPEVEKGLVGVRAENRLEVRAHTLSPRAELKELTEWLTLSPTTAERRMKDETQTHLTPQALKEIAQYDPGALIDLVDGSSFERPKAKVRLSSPEVQEALLAVPLFSFDALDSMIDASKTLRRAKNEADSRVLRPKLSEHLFSTRLWEGNGAELTESQVWELTRAAHELGFTNPELSASAEESVLNYIEKHQNEANILVAWREMAQQNPAARTRLLKAITVPFPSADKDTLARLAQTYMVIDDYLRVAAIETYAPILLSDDPQLRKRGYDRIQSLMNRPQLVAAIFTNALKTARGSRRDELLDQMVFYSRKYPTFRPVVEQCDPEGFARLRYQDRPGAP